MQGRHPTSPSRAGRIAVITVVVAMLCTLAFVAPAAASDPGAESQFVSQINGLRASRGVPGLAVDGSLTAKAQGWAAHMASGGCGGGICHSNLADGVGGGWQRLAENVGMGPSVSAVHAAFVGSSAHYANMVDGGFDRVGVGVASAGGQLFVAEVFMQSSGGGTAPVARTASPSAPRVAPARRASTAARPSALALAMLAAQRQADTERFLQAIRAHERVTHRRLCQQREPECVRRAAAP